jgi:hypothetical protein
VKLVSFKYFASIIHTCLDFPSPFFDTTSTASLITLIWFCLWSLCFLQANDICWSRSFCCCSEVSTGHDAHVTLPVHDRSMLFECARSTNKSSVPFGLRFASIRLPVCDIALAGLLHRIISLKTGQTLAPLSSFPGTYQYNTTGSSLPSMAHDGFSEPWSEASSLCC